MKHCLFSVALSAFLAAGLANGQLTDDFHPPPSNCCLVNAAKRLADQLQDWNQLGRYHPADQELRKLPPDPGRVVFLGDSITDFWKLDQYFPGRPYINRGISGQTTPQMLVRMYPDVIDLKPGAMILLAGINDVSRNTGPSTAEMIEENIMAMTELAQRHGIQVILCSLLPVSDYPFLKQQSEPAARPPGPFPGLGPFPKIKMTTEHPPGDVLKLNSWMKEYAARAGVIYADYFAALVDEKGRLKEPLSGDGLHPNAEGYQVMAPIAQAAIEKALRR